jgi:hypothetical protein
VPRSTVLTDPNGDPPSSARFRNTVTKCDEVWPARVRVSQSSTFRTFITKEDADSGGTTGDPTSYCVSGNTLKVKSKDGSIINATRK